MKRWLGSLRSDGRPPARDFSNVFKFQIENRKYKAA